MPGQSQAAPSSPIASADSGGCGVRSATPPAAPAVAARRALCAGDPRDDPALLSRPVFAIAICEQAHSRSRNRGQPFPALRRRRESAPDCPASVANGFVDEILHPTRDKHRGPRAIPLPLCWTSNSVDSAFFFFFIREPLTSPAGHSRLFSPFRLDMVSLSPVPSGRRRQAGKSFV